MTLVEFCNEYKDLLEGIDKDFPRAFSIKGEEIYQNRFEIYKEEPMFLLSGILHSIKLAFNGIEEKTEELEKNINHFETIKHKLDQFADTSDLSKQEQEVTKMLISLFRQKVHL